MVIDECKKAGHPKPIFSQDSLGVQVTLPSKEPLGFSSAAQIENTNYQDLLPRQHEIINFVKKQGKITLKELMNNLSENLSERTIQIELSKLRDLQILESLGFGRGSKWTIKTRKKDDIKTT